MKTVWKVTPVPLYDLAGLEGWLEEMACRGLFPNWVGGSFSSFSPAGKPGTRFRLEGAGGREQPEADRLELYRASGWEYVDSVFLKLYFLYYTADPAAPELHTDPVTQGYSLNALAREVKKQRRSYQVSRWLVLAILALGIVLPLVLRPRRAALLLLDYTGLMLFLLIGFFLGWRSSERTFRLLLDLHRRLENGIPLEPRAVRLTRWQRFQRLMAIPLVLLVAGALIAGRWMKQPLPLGDFSRPHVTLEELEREPLTDFMEIYGPHSRHEEDNAVIRGFSLLSPVYYTVTQSMYGLEEGTMPGALSPLGGPEYRYACHLEGSYYHLAVPALAKSIARARLADLEAVNLTWTYEERTYPGLDFVILGRNSQDDIWQSAALGLGGRVAVFHYGGQERLEEHLPLLAGVVHSFS